MLALSHLEFIFMLCGLMLSLFGWVNWEGYCWTWEINSAVLYAMHYEPPKINHRGKHMPNNSKDTSIDCEAVQCSVQLGWGHQVRACSFSGIYIKL